MVFEGRIPRSKGPKPLTQRQLAMRKKRLSSTSSSSSSSSSSTSSSSSSLVSTTAIFKLDPQCELRFEVEEPNSEITLVLKSGLAEIFGTELVAGIKYVFKINAEMGIFTWNGCTLELTGQIESCYISKSTPMMLYGNCHTALEYMREAAEKLDNGRGPVTMIVGPKNVGKLTLSRILLNYAVRMGRKPLFVDLDVSRGCVAVPGTIGALSIERPANVIEGFSRTAPLAFHYGDESPTANDALYKLIISRLAKVCVSRFQANAKTRVSGMVINTIGWESSHGLENLKHAAKEFGVNAILVLDYQRLHHQLVQELSSHVNIIYLPKSGGVVAHDEVQRNVLRDQRWHEYFYGSKIQLHPHSLTVKWKNVTIMESNGTTLTHVTPGSNLLHHILSVSFSKSLNQALEHNVAGFVCITNVDVRRKTLTILSPQPQLPPNIVLIRSELRYLDL